MFNGARIIGPAIAGILIALFGEGMCFFLNVISYIPIIIFLFLVKSKEQIIKEFSSPIGHLKEGLLFAWKNKPIRALLLLVGIYSFFGMSFSMLLPIFSDQILKSGVKGLGILMGASGVGAVLGGLFLASRKKVIGIKKLIAISSVIFSLSLFVFAISKSFILSIFMLFIIGLCFMIINAGSNTSIQVMSPDYIRGRIIGLYSMMFMGMFPIGSLVIGYLAQRFNPSFAVSVGASVCLIIGIYFSLKVPKLTLQAKNLFEAQEKIEQIV